MIWIALKASAVHIDDNALQRIEIKEDEYGHFVDLAGIAMLRAESKEKCYDVYNAICENLKRKRSFIDIREY